MFTSEKELRNKKPTTGSASSGGIKSNRNTTSMSSSTSTFGNSSINSSANIVETSKQLREERQLKREQVKLIVIIQSWWRCKHTRNTWRKNLQLEFTKKCEDIQNVNNLLKLKICPDNKISILLIRSLLFSTTTYVNNITNITYLCNLLLYPSLTHMDISKNIATLLSPYLAYCIFVLLLSFFSQPSIKYQTNKNETNDEANNKIQIMSCLRLLIGSGNSIKIEFAESLELSFLHIRTYLEKTDIFSQISELFYLKLDRWMLATNNDDSSPYVNTSKASTRNDDITYLDILFEFIQYFVMIDTNLKTKQYRFMRFIQTTFTIPMLTLLLSLSTIQAFTMSELFQDILKYLSQKFPKYELLLSKIPAFDPEIWIMGNVVSLSHAVLHISTTQEDFQESFLHDYLRLCTKFILQFPVPGLLYGKRGVVWTRRGTESIAAGVPTGLYSQMNYLFDSNFLSILTNLLLVSVDIDEDISDGNGSIFEGREADINEITEALKSTGMHVASHAIEEVAADRSWYSGKWAMKLFRNVTSVLPFSATNSTIFAANNVESKSDGKEQYKGYHGVRKRGTLDQDNIFSLCSLLSVILAPAALSNYNSENWKGLSSLVFSHKMLISKLWFVALSLKIEEFAVKFTPITDVSPKGIFGVITTLATILRLSLLVSDDHELYEEHRPLPLHQIYILIRSFKVILFKIIQYDETLLTDSTLLDGSNSSINSKDTVGTFRLYGYHAAKVISLVLTDLYTRWARRPYSTSTLFEIKEANFSDIRTQLRQKTPFAIALLTAMPWSIEFYERLSLFREIITNDRISHQGTQNHRVNMEDVLLIRIRRRNLLEDGMKNIEKIAISGNLKKRMMIKYINDFNEEELGIDSGGLFKDFWTELASQIFNSNYGLFATTSTRQLYPSSTALNLYNEREIEKMFYFLGLVLGKAIFENITVQPLFAHFFLAFMLGKYDFTGLINDLITLDPELYKNLMFLKQYEGDIGDLCLTFAVTDTSLGINKDIELIPGGSNIAVDGSNRHKYINAVAKYYLHDRLKLQAKSFFSGLYRIIDPSLFTMFCAPELQFLISGASAAINIDDLKRNTSYLAGYSSLDRNISRFWSVLESMHQDDLSLLIRFVTSCDRPPSLGFADLQPPFTIQRVDSENDSRLPTASTCFNVLKLPAYSNQAVLKEKLLFAIRSRSGFDLS